MTADGTRRSKRPRGEDLQRIKEQKEKEKAKRVGGALPGFKYVFNAGKQ